MKITVWDWRAGGQLLLGTPHVHGEVIEGEAEDAFRIARELYDRGLNVMVRRCPARNLGTKKRPMIDPESIFVAVDEFTFQQR